MNIFIKDLTNFIEKEVNTNIFELDYDYEKLKTVFENYSKTELYHVSLTNNYKNYQLSQLDINLKRILLAKNSLSFAWLVSSGEAIMGFLKPHQEETKVKEILDDFKKGKSYGVYVLKNKNALTMKLTKDNDGGYIVNGFAPYVTGHEVFKEAIMFALDEQEELIAFKIPFKTSLTIFVKELNLSIPNTSKSAFVKFNNHKINENDIILKTKYIPKENKKIPVQAFYLIGLTQKTLALINPEQLKSNQVLYNQYSKINELQEKFIDDYGTCVEIANWKEIKAKAILICQMAILFYQTLLKGRSVVPNTHVHDLYSAFRVYTSIGKEMNTDHEFLINTMIKNIKNF